MSNVDTTGPLYFKVDGRGDTHYLGNWYHETPDGTHIPMGRVDHRDKTITIGRPDYSLQLVNGKIRR